jgi:hypothetical protein
MPLGAVTVKEIKHGLHFVTGLRFVELALLAALRVDTII